ncbi:MAG: tetratricopeptide repeat protein [Armatimonadetes bacterium]|nr:tetratricopeptide repeat protein [Armatimonadota bacterium]
MADSSCGRCLFALVFAVAAAGHGHGALTTAERLDILWDRAIRQTDFGKAADAEASARLALRIAPDRADAWAVAAVVYAATPAGGRPALAREAAERAMALDPGNARAHYAMGVVDYASGDAAAAEARFRRAAELCEGFARAHGMQAWALWDLGRYDEGVAATRRAVHLEPRGFYWHQNLAIMLGELGELDAALEESALALELAPGDQWKAVAYNNRAYLHAYSDELAEALAAAEAALALSPDDPAVLDTAGLVCALDGQVGRAEGYLRRALAGGYASLPKLAYVLAIKGDDSGAREALRQSRGDLMGPGAAMDALYAAGLAYERLGDPEVTRRIFRQTATLRPTHPWSQAMRQHLADG